MKPEKLSLKDLKVKSFITSVPDGIKGGNDSLNDDRSDGLCPKSGPYCETIINCPPPTVNCFTQANNPDCFSFAVDCDSQPF